MEQEQDTEQLYRWESDCVVSNVPLSDFDAYELEDLVMQGIAPSEAARRVGVNWDRVNKMQRLALTDKYYHAKRFATDDHLSPVTIAGLQNTITALAEAWGDTIKQPHFHRFDRRWHKSV